jgi:putative membrane protein
VTLRGARIAIVLIALAGLAVATALVAYYGWADIGHALAAAGWRGLLAVAAAHLGFWTLCGLAWRALLVEAPAHVLAGLVWARWVRDAGSDLLPISSLGGDLMGVRSAVLCGLPPAQALGSTVVDITLELIAQLAFTVIGLVLLLLLPTDAALARPTVIGLLVAAPLAIGFVAAQRVGLFLLIERTGQRLARRWRWSALAGAEGMHRAIRQIHAARGRIAAGFTLHLAGWMASAAEAWLALGFLDAQPGFLVVLVIESLAYGLRSAAFVVPGAFGVQEGGYVLLGPLFGIGPDVMLALSLLKRARDLLLGVPALALWQWLEGGRWRHRRAQ